jgi:putative copper resistance protein D
LGGAPLVAARAVHFAATSMMVAGAIFDAFLAKPLLRRHVISFQGGKGWVTWVYLAFAVVSGGFWLLLQASSMSGMPLNEVLTTSVLSIVVNETQFGHVTTIRIGLVICLAVCLVFRRAVAAHWLGLAAAVSFAGSLAWTGHAGATVGLTGYMHLAADVLHVVATAAWIGGIAALIKFLRIPALLDKCGSVVTRSTGFRCWALSA